MYMCRCVHISHPIVHNLTARISSLSLMELGRLAMAIWSMQRRMSGISRKDTCRSIKHGAGKNLILQQTCNGIQDFPASGIASGISQKDLECALWLNLGTEQPKVLLCARSMHATKHTSLHDACQACSTTTYLMWHGNALHQLVVIWLQEVHHDADAASTLQNFRS